MSSVPLLSNANPGDSIPLVVGLGSFLAADDSVGVELIRLLRKQTGLECEFLELGDAGLMLLEIFQRKGWILFVDAVSSGLAPGTIHLIPLPSADIESKLLGRFSSHGIGLPEVLQLCRALGRPIPALMLLGIEVEAINHGEVRSAPVEDALQTVVTRFSSLIQLLKSDTSLLWREGHRYVAGYGSFPNCAEVEPECENLPTLLDSH